MRYTHSRQIDKCLPIADWSDPMWNTEGGKMPNYAYPVSESSEHHQSFDKTKVHQTTEESLLESHRTPG